MSDNKSPGQVAYEEYRGGSAFYPTWESAEPSRRKFWENIAAKVVAEIPTITFLKRLFRELSDEDRLAWINDNFPCCRHCGSLDTSCQCWNDE